MEPEPGGTLMNFVFISPNFPSDYCRFCVCLKRNGVNVLGIGDESYDSLRPELKEALTEYYKVDSFFDRDQLIRAMGYLTFRYGKTRYGSLAMASLATARRPWAIRRTCSCAAGCGA